MRVCVRASERVHSSCAQTGICLCACYIHASQSAKRNGKTHAAFPTHHLHTHTHIHTQACSVTLRLNSSGSQPTAASFTSNLHLLHGGALPLAWWRPTSCMVTLYLLHGGALPLAWWRPTSCMVALYLLHGGTSCMVAPFLLHGSALATLFCWLKPWPATGVLVPTC